MNSDDILRQLSKLARDTNLNPQQKQVVEATITHLRKLGEYTLGLREDITDMTIPED